MIPPLQACSRVLAVLLCGAFAAVVTPAAAVDVTFVLDEQQSLLTIDASTVFIINFSDSDTQALGGSIDTSLDLGRSGVFPSAAGITVNGAAISPLNPFSMTLGSPPFGVDVDVTGAVADVTTLNPPAALTRAIDTLIRYEFDAAEFGISLNQGSVVVRGAVNQTIDLATTPVTGTAQPGTLGSLTLTTTGMSGFFTQIDALLELPVLFTEIVDIDGQLVTLDVAGEILANSSFQVALAGLPGDFDGDGDVDSEDLAQWIGDFGGLGSDADGDGDSDGADFLVWQQQFGSGMLPLAASQSIPEPHCVTLLGCASLLLALTRR